MKTLQELWKEYRDRVYPDGISATQNQECHQAFFSGALVAIVEITLVTELPEDQAVACIHQLFQEAEEICRAYSLMSRRPA